LNANSETSSHVASQETLLPAVGGHNLNGGSPLNLPILEKSFQATTTTDTLKLVFPSGSPVKLTPSSSNFDHSTNAPSAVTDTIKRADFQDNSANTNSASYPAPENSTSLDAPIIQSAPRKRDNDASINKFDVISNSPKLRESSVSNGVEVGYPENDFPEEWEPENLIAEAIPPDMGLPEPPNAWSPITIIFGSRTGIKPKLPKGKRKLKDNKLASEGNYSTSQLRNPTYALSKFDNAKGTENPSNLGPLVPSQPKNIPLQSSKAASLQREKQQENTNGLPSNVSNVPIRGPKTSNSTGKNAIPMRKQESVNDSTVPLIIQFPANLHEGQPVRVSSTHKKYQSNEAFRALPMNSQVQVDPDTNLSDPNFEGGTADTPIAATANSTFDMLKNETSASFASHSAMAHQLGKISSPKSPPVSIPISLRFGGEEAANSSPTNNLKETALGIGTIPPNFLNESQNPMLHTSEVVTTSLSLPTLEFSSGSTRVLKIPSTPPTSSTIVRNTSTSGPQLTISSSTENNIPSTLTHDDVKVNYLSLFDKLNSNKSNFESPKKNGSGTIRSLLNPCNELISYFEISISVHGKYSQS
jgi:hypothetical protein